uniref:CSON008995 protein n=1 Tax=Culicoides sonorensis TaxID=179676 RepID=A0A336MXA4_CULSO
MPVVPDTQDEELVKLRELFDEVRSLLDDKPNDEEPNERSEDATSTQGDNNTQSNGDNEVRTGNDTTTPPTDNEAEHNSSDNVSPEISGASTEYHSSNSLANSSSESLRSTVQNSPTGSIDYGPEESDDDNGEALDDNGDVSDDSAATVEYLPSDSMLRFSIQETSGSDLQIGLIEQNESSIQSDTNAQDESVQSNAQNVETVDNDSDIEEIVQPVPLIVIDSTIDNEPHEPLNANSSSNVTQDDDVVFVQQVRNDNPIVIDLSNTLDDGFAVPSSSTPLIPSRRRRRNQEPIDIEDGPTPPQRPRIPNIFENLYQEIQIRFGPSNPTPQMSFPKTPVPSTSTTSHDDESLNSTQSEPIDFKCAICLSNPRNRQPVSTFCGHIYCKSCIEACIQSTHKCPLCKKPLTMKKIHRLFF